MKYTARRDVARCRPEDEKALLEMRIRGVKTNVPFLLNVLEHPTSAKGRHDLLHWGQPVLSIGKSAWDVAHSSRRRCFRVELNLRYLAVA